MNTYDPADYISYVTMDRQLAGGSAAATPVGTGGRLPRGYANASPSTRLRNRAAAHAVFDDDHAAPVPAPSGTTVAPCRSDGTPDERVGPVVGSLARRAACGGARPADPAAALFGRPSHRREPSAG